jgi:hypothetical protein
MTGLGYLVGTNIVRNQAVHTPIVATTLAAATSTAEVFATQTALPTPTPLPSVNPLADAQILVSDICKSTGTGCPSWSSPTFGTYGPFVIAWVCFHDYASPDSNAQLQMQLFNSTGHQVDVLSESCQGNTTNNGIIPEKLPAGTYTISYGATDGPSWAVMALEDYAPAAQGN